MIPTGKGNEGVQAILEESALIRVFHAVNRRYTGLPSIALRLLAEVDNLPEILVGHAIDARRTRCPLSENGASKGAMRMNVSQ